jgi:tetratricopeptide (TPR) repeat protein
MRSLAAALLLSVPLFVFADDDPHAHHQHGAPDLGNIGKAHHDTSCAEAAQKEIDRGVTLIHSFWYGPAEQAFRKAAEADPTSPQAWNNLAYALAEQGRRAEAIAAAERAVALGGANADPYRATLQELSQAPSS